MQLFRPAAQHFGHSPGLSKATPRREGLLSVEDLRHRADPVVAEVVPEGASIRDAVSRLAGERSLTLR